MKESKYNDRQGRGARPRALYTLFLGALFGLYLLSSCSTAPLRRPRSFTPPKERRRMEVGAFARALHRTLRMEGPTIRWEVARHIPRGQRAERMIIVPSLRFRAEIYEYEYYNKFGRRPYFHTWEELLGLLDTESFRFVDVLVQLMGGGWYRYSFSLRVKTLEPLDPKSIPLEELSSGDAPLVFDIAAYNRRFVISPDGQLRVYDRRTTSRGDQCMDLSEVLQTMARDLQGIYPDYLRGRDYRGRGKSFRR